MIKFEDSTVLITGGTNGIGLEFVKQLDEIGAKIIITGSNLLELKETKKNYPKIHTILCDLSNPREVEKMNFEINQNFPSLNIIINNGSHLGLIDLENASLEIKEINEEIAANLIAPIQIVYKLMPMLKNASTAAIVNVTAGMELLSYAAAPVYSATKAGFRGYTAALRLHLEETSIKVFEIIPPDINSNYQTDATSQVNPKIKADISKLVSLAIEGINLGVPIIKPQLFNVLKIDKRMAMVL